MQKFDEQYGFVEFLGFGKKAKAKKLIKLEKKAIKNQMLSAKVNLKNAKADSIKAGADPGSFGLGGIIKDIGGIFKPAEAPADSTGTEPAEAYSTAALVPAEGEKPNMVMIGGIVLAAIVAVIIFVKVIR
jgi:hypothetical protein